MMRGISILAFMGLMVFGSASISQGALIDMGDGTIYDTDLQLTWLKDANYAMTSGYDADGRMNWVDAKIWATNLAYAGFDDWRLPETLQPDPTCSNQADPDGAGGDPPIGYGYGCTVSEMGHLFYTELGNSPGTLSNAGDFQNLRINDNYWSITRYGNDRAWIFFFDTGDQGTNLGGADNYAWAVRPGERSTSTVPEPATLLLLGSGLTGVGLIRFRGHRPNRWIRRPDRWQIPPSAGRAGSSLTSSKPAPFA